MVLLAGAALWLTICASFAVFAVIVGMPPFVIAQSLAVASLNVGAIAGVIFVVVLLRRQLGDPHASPPPGAG